MKKLKEDRQTSGSGYKGKSDWLVWWQIHPEAIIKVVGFDEIQNLAASNPDVGRLLRLNYFSCSKSVTKLRERMLEQPLKLDSESGVAMGKMASLFGFRLGSPKPYLEARIYSLAQG